MGGGFGGAIYSYLNGITISKSEFEGNSSGNGGVGGTGGNGGSGGDGDISSMAGEEGPAAMEGWVGMAVMDLKGVMVVQ